MKFNEYYYIATDILEEYATSYSQVDKEHLARVLNELVAEKIEKFAERLKAMAYESTDWSHGVHPMVVEVDYIDEILEEFEND